MSYSNSDWLPTGAKYQALKSLFKRHMDSLQEGMDGVNRFLIIKNSDNSLENEIIQAFESITLEDAVHIMVYINYGFSDSYQVCGICNRIICVEDSFYPTFWYDYEKNRYVCKDCTVVDKITRYIDQARINCKNTVYSTIISMDELKERGWFKFGRQYCTYKNVPKEVDEEVRKTFPGADVLYYMTGIDSQYYVFNAWVKNIILQSDQVIGLIQEEINERTRTLERNKEKFPLYYPEAMIYLQRQDELITMLGELSRLNRRMHKLIEKIVEEKSKKSND